MTNISDMQILLVATLMITIAVTDTCADLIGFTDREEWEAAVGDFTTITFTEYPMGTVLYDHYSDLGILFTDKNDWIWHDSGFVNDGAGVVAGFNDEITVEFDTPQLWFAADHVATLAFDVYASGEFVGSFTHSASGPGHFTGIISETAFDMVVLYRHTGGKPFIDDIHWGVPAPAVIGVFAVATFFGGTRRRGGRS